MNRYSSGRNMNHRHDSTAKSLLPILVCLSLFAPFSVQAFLPKLTTILNPHQYCGCRQTDTPHNILLRKNPPLLLLSNPPLLNAQDDNQQDSSSSHSNSDDPVLNPAQISLIFDSIVSSRKACKKFQRHDGNYTDAAREHASESNSAMVQQALQSLQVAQQAPSSFNTQPYKLVLVHSAEQKQKLSRYALGPNRKRVLDSDCTVVFLADRQVMRTFRRYLRFQNNNNSNNNSSNNRRAQLRTLFYITLFSSGYPLPRILAAPISFGVRLVCSIVETLIRWYYVLPSFSTAETWATKQTLLVAMTYMLACTSRGLATCPMEGINAAGIRSVLKIPRRYAIPLIVATGKQYQQERQQQQPSLAASTALQAAAVETPPPLLEKSSTPRYPSEEIIFCNMFGGGYGNLLMGQVA